MNSLLSHIILISSMQKNELRGKEKKSSKDKAKGQNKLWLYIGNDSNSQTDVQCSMSIFRIGHSIWNNSKTTDH